MTYRKFALTSALAMSISGMAGVAAAQEGERYEFDTLDVDGDGNVTVAELEAVIDTGVDSDANPVAILEAQDENNDGVISREEAGADDAIYTLEPTEEAGETE